MVLISKSKVKKQQGCASLQGRRGIEHRAANVANVANAIAASNLWNFEKNGLSFAARVMTQCKALSEGDSRDRGWGGGG